MIQFFRKSPKKLNDFSFLGADMHNHVLPGIDDGASTVQDSLLLMLELRLLGFSKLIPTPHIIDAIYPNNLDTINEAYQKVISQTEVDRNILPDINSYSAEYYLDNNFTDLRKKAQLLSFGDKYVLVEMSYADISQNMEEEIFQLQLLGYQPILAHPERYSYLHGNKDYYLKLVSMGCHFQLNLLSLTDHYGKNIRKMAMYLLEQELYHWAGTDVHSLKHIHLLQQLLTDKLFNKIVNYPFYNKTLL